MSYALYALPPCGCFYVRKIIVKSLKKFSLMRVVELVFFPKGFNLTGLKLAASHVIDAHGAGTNSILCEGEVFFFIII